MTFDDELRARMQQAADQAGAGADPAAMTATASTAATSGAGGAAAASTWRLFGLLAVTGLVVGGALGFTVLQPDDTAASEAPAVVVDGYALYDCPDGSPAGSARPGDRVWVTGRDDAGAWLQIRDPRDPARHRWVVASAVVPDDATASVDAVPVASCDVTTVLVVSGNTSTTTSSTTTTVPTSTTTATSTTVAATVAPTTPPTAPPTTANVPPSIGAVSANPSTVAGGCSPDSSTISVPVTDQSGIASVRLDWSYPRETSGTASGTVNLSGSGGQYSGDVVVTLTPPVEGVYASLTITATDVNGLSSVKHANKVLFVEFCLP
ncbi:MAG TPA: hypothetical protein VMS14_10790 [Ilumatobacteraceae bacterium]|nr:hypothetical protein [Ilumatobacteraceae bacterium]HUC33883.1 hypothetical protein [Ilumatobacteraceae bacterium]